MLRISAPASSANLGPGFDCLGIALDLYNSFDVELTADHHILENVEDRFNNDDNLFLQAWRKGCEAIGVNDFLHVVFHCDIPVSRGLGSSAALIAGGLAAASVLHDDALSDDQIFQLASAMEGHPDNAAPCVFGALCASMTTNSRYIARKLPLDDGWHFTALIPDFEVTTEAARKILPDSYPRKEAAANAAHAVLMTNALMTGDPFLLKEAAVDYIHEPYRKTLIHDFDSVKKICEKDTGGVLLISGSGSTCLLISKYALTENAMQKIAGLKEHHWQKRELHPAVHGTEIKGVL